MPALRVAAPLLYLLVLAVVSVVVADTSWKTVTTYRSGYALDRQFQAGPALAGRVVLVVLDGLRTDRAADLPAFGSLAERGVSGTAEVTLPSLSNPARAAFVTGALPEVSGVTNNSSFSPPPVQSLFSLARDRGIETAVFGSSFWPRAFGDYIDSYLAPSGKASSYDAADLVEWQERSCVEAAEHLVGSIAALHVVGVLAGDEAGHNYGGESDGYRQVTSAVDACLGRLVAVAGPDTAVLAVSDHGHIDRWGKGGHGGEEAEVLFAPFALAGPGIRASDPLEARIVDIAPTASVLLGLPIPANSQGRVLWEALDLPADHEADLRELEREQREALRKHMPNREESLAAQRSDRLPGALAAGAWFLAVAFFAAYRQRLGAFAIAVVAFVAAYYLSFYLFQLGYSISSVVRQEYLYPFFARNVGAAALGFLAAAACLRRLAGRGSETVLRLAALITSALALLVATTHYRHGLFMQGWMIEIGPGFKAYLDMLAILGVVLGTVLLLAFDSLQRRREGRRP